jgi:hypothetical protein
LGNKQKRQKDLKIQKGRQLGDIQKGNKREEHTKEKEDWGPYTNEGDWEIY